MPFMHCQKAWWCSCYSSLGCLHNSMADLLTTLSSQFFSFILLLCSSSNVFLSINLPAHYYVDLSTIYVFLDYFTHWTWMFSDLLIGRILAMSRSVDVLNVGHAPFFLRHRINPWSPGGSFTVQKTAVTSPIPAFEGLKFSWFIVTCTVSNAVRMWDISFVYIGSLSSWSQTSFLSQGFVDFSQMQVWCSQVILFPFLWDIFVLRHRHFLCYYYC